MATDATTKAADSTGDALLVQRRVGLFGLVGASMTMFALGTSLIHFAVERAAESPIPRAFHAFGGVILLATWLLCRKGKRSIRFVRALEIVSTVSCTTAFAIMTAHFPTLSRPDLLATLITAQVVTARAILVPSTGKRTAVLSLLASLPLFGVALVVANKLQAATLGPGTTLVELLISAFMWTILTTGLATAAASVIYGLRRQVRKAMELGQYTLLEKLGEGGMGQVFRARHAMLRRPTAVKLLHSESPEDLARFEREVQLTAQLTHPNTITVFDYGKTPDGVFYYAMELLDGFDLQKLVERDGPMPAARVVHILIQVADALAEAHGVGLIHRDIKPANIILAPRGTSFDVAKVLDFGLVKSAGLHESSKLEVTAAKLDVSSANAVLGTPLYMAPETIRSPERVDARTDLYALGAVGYFLLTGTPVFHGTTLAALLADHLHTKPIAPRTRLGGDVPPDLEELVLACLAKSQDDRPSTALALRDRLRACNDADTWTEEQAKACWEAAPSSKVMNESEWSAKTIAVDMGQRSPRALTLP